MPPKKNTAQKAKDKVVEDRTFGLKNKNKSKKVQKYIAGVKHAVNHAGARKAKDEPPKTKKELEKEKMEERAALFTPVITQTQVKAGVDPKSVLCQFFVQGSCLRGNKCKYSHDAGIARKVEKIDIYTDTRSLAGPSSNELETNENWDIDKLSSVVESKRTQANRNIPTEIVCKYFLDAVETKKYGWFWECPNGDRCIYRHALPPGFVIQTKHDSQEEVEDTPLEDILEDERRAFRQSGKSGTSVTLELFLAWREQRKKKKAEEEELVKASSEQKAQQKQLNRRLLSGREMFVFKPEIFVDDEGASDDIYELQTEEDATDIHVIEVTGTSITRTVIKGKGNTDEAGPSSNSASEDCNAGPTNTNEDNEGDESIAKTETAEGSTVPINESLFAADENIPEEFGSDDDN